MKKLGIAIIGCGAAARKYYVPAIKRHPDLIQGLILIDKNRDLAEQLRDEVGGGHVHDDYISVVNKVRGAVIAVPHFVHYQIALDLLGAGIHVLCEKPIAELPSQAWQMIKIANDHNVKLCVNNTRRMFPAFIEVRNIIKSGRLGRLKAIEYIEGNIFGWESATGFYVNPRVSAKGILLDIGAHAIDTLCWWLDGKPTLISYKDDSFSGPESVVEIHSKMGDCGIHVSLNRLCDLDNTYRIIGEKGIIEGKVHEYNRLRTRLNEDNVLREKVIRSSNRYPNFFTAIFDNFIQVIDCAASPLIPGSAVMDSIEFIQECYSSRKQMTSSFYSRIDVPSTLKRHKPLNNRGKVLVTGSTGFIGCRAVELIHLADLMDVRACIRRWPSAARLGRFPVDIVTMDVLNKDQINKALEGVTDIIHCAYGNEEVTVHGTENLLEAALEHGIRRFVHLSTAEVYGSALGIVDEKFPLEYTGNIYNKIKIDAEKVCWNYLKRGLPVTIIRPSIVYGPFSRNWTMKIALLFKDNQGGIYDNYGDGKCNLVYVDDLIWAMMMALYHDKAVGEAFNVTGPEVITWNEYFRLFNDMMGLPPLKIIQYEQARTKALMMEPVRKLGRFMKDHFLDYMKIIADHVEIAGNLMRKTERIMKTIPSPEELSLFNRDVFYSTEKLKNTLGFEPDISVSQGLRTSVEWIIQQGILNNNTRRSDHV